MIFDSKMFLGLLLLAVGYASGDLCYPEYNFICANGNGCTSLNYRCDRDKDCADGSDEAAELCKDNCAGLEERFQCSDGTCIRKSHICNGSPECSDGSDEAENLCADCNGNDNLWRCKGSGSTKCINKHYRCDGQLDCGENDPSDEDGSICDENCGGGEDRFQCANKKCIYARRTCNGENDCGDNSDESDGVCANCNGVEGKTKCRDSNKCFRESSDRCDGLKDCNVEDENDNLTVEDNTDEENCPSK